MQTTQSNSTASPSARTNGPPAPAATWLTSSSRYNLSKEVVTWMHSKGDDGIRGRAAVGALTGRDGGENSAIMFESFAFNVLTARGEGATSGSARGEGGHSNGVTSVTGDGCCREYHRGSELLFCICPNSIYLFPHERIKTAFLSEVTVHVNCSCPFPCLELRIMATVPQGLQRRFVGSSHTSGTTTSGGIAAKGSSNYSPASTSSNGTSYSSPTIIGGSNNMIAKNKTFSNASSYAYINDREAAAQMSRRQKEQQKTFIRIIGFGSEGLLREAVSVLMELGAKPPPVSEHFKQILSPIVSESRGGGDNARGAGNHGNTKISSSSPHGDSFMFEANGNSEQLKRSPFYSSPTTASSPRGIVVGSAGRARNSTAPLPPVEPFRVLTSGANSQHISGKDRNAAIDAAMEHALSLPAAPMLRLVFHAQSWEDASHIGGGLINSSHSGGGIVGSSTSAPQHRTNHWSDVNLGGGEMGGEEHSAAGVITASSTHLPEYPALGTDNSSLSSRLKIFRERRREREKRDHIMNQLSGHSAASPNPLLSPQLLPTYQHQQEHSISSSAIQQDDATRTVGYRGGGEGVSQINGSSNIIAHGIHPRHTDPHMGRGSLSDGENVGATMSSPAALDFHDVEDQATNMLATIEAMLKESNAALSSPQTTPRQSIHRRSFTK